jgi:hypothetical protein
MNQPSLPEQQGCRQSLTELRERLVDLHKTLIESERIGYEATFGALSSPNRFLQVLINDPWFAWLHPLSELIVVIDEALEAEEPVTGQRLAQFLATTRELLQASEEGDGFPRSYFEALQREPDVVMAHAEVVKCFKNAA